MSDTGQVVAPTPPKWQDVETLSVVRSRYRASIWIWLAVIPVGFAGILLMPDSSSLAIIIPGIQFIAMLVLMSSALEGSEILGLNVILIVLLGLFLIFVPFGPLVLLVSMGTRLSARFVSWGFSGMSDPRIAAYIDDGRRGFALQAVKRQEAEAERKKMSQDLALSDLLSHVGFSEWVKYLDSYLAETGTNTRSTHFAIPALAYGFLNHMKPAAFVKVGYNQFADPADIFGVGPKTSQPQPARSEARNESPIPPIPAPIVETPSRTSPIDMTMIEKLERLAALHNSGALTDEEFVAEKTRLLRHEV